MSPAKGASAASSEQAELAALVHDRSIVICSGSGGVGKTTTAAVLAMEAAAAGRRAVVVTIDPAKRLADALGLDGIGNAPKQIDGPWSGELWAVMLDTKSTFDDLVTQYSADPEQAERILANRFYKNISGALSGTQEYMAMEKLYALHADEAFDLVVVDTPPSRNALDFLEAPRRLTRFLDHRLYRVLMAPTRGVMKAVNVAAQAFVRSVSKVVGGEVFDDAVAFFQAFDGMEAGFKERAELVLDLLTSPVTAFVLVASPAGTRWTRPGSSPTSSPRPTSRCRRSSSTACTLGSPTHCPSRCGPAPTPSTAPTSAGSTATWPTSPSWPPARRSTSPAWPSRWRPPR
ncbi:MAG: ArsA-related P-loop ATPase [Acidimicrobiales bacterium]